MWSQQVYPNYYKKVHNYIKNSSLIEYKKKVLFGKYKDDKFIIWWAKTNSTN